MAQVEEDHGKAWKLMYAQARALGFRPEQASEIARLYAFVAGEEMSTWSERRRWRALGILDGKNRLKVEFYYRNKSSNESVVSLFFYVKEGVSKNYVGIVCLNVHMRKSF